MKRLRPAFALVGLVMLIAAGLTACTTAGSGQPASSSMSVSDMLNQARSNAIHQILLAFHSKNPVQRTNALEAIQPVRDRARPMAEAGLDDRSVPVRFAALVTVGKLKLTSLAGQAKQMVHAKNKSIQAAAIFAAHQCGLKVNIGRLAYLFASPNPTVRGNTAMLLGQMGNDSAVGMIKDLSQQPMPRASETRAAVVRLQVAQALVNLGDDGALGALRAGVYSPYNEVRILAVQMLGREQDRSMIRGLQQMIHQNPIQLQVAAAEALARMGERAGQSIVLSAAGSSAASVRAQAAFALGVLRTPPAIRKLVAMLNDKKAAVRLAAAASIIQALHPNQAT